MNSGRWNEWVGGWVGGWVGEHYLDVVALGQELLDELAGHVAIAARDADGAGGWCGASSSSSS